MLTRSIRRARGLGYEREAHTTVLNVFESICVLNVFVVMALKLALTLASAVGSALAAALASALALASACLATCFKNL